MAWEWSHSPEAYASIREQIHAQSEEWLRVVFAEWKAWIASGRRGGTSNFSERPYNTALRMAAKLPESALADEIWTQTEEFRTCDNGGWEAWCCPYGCHTLPFSGGESED